MVALKALVNSSVPGGIGEESNPPTADDNRMPKAAVDPYGLLYKPADPETGEPIAELLYTVPDSNFQGETLSEDPHLAPLKDAILAIEEKTEPEEPVEPEEQDVPEEENYLA